MSQDIPATEESYGIQDDEAALDVLGVGAAAYGAYELSRGNTKAGSKLVLGGIAAVAGRRAVQDFMEQ